MSLDQESLRGLTETIAESMLSSQELPDFSKMGLRALVEWIAANQSKIEAIHLLPPVDTAADLPDDATPGDMREVLDTGIFYIFYEEDGTASHWVQTGGLTDLSKVQNSISSINERLSGIDNSSAAAQVWIYKQLVAEGAYFDGNRVGGLAEPQLASDATTKKYVDSITNGIVNSDTTTEMDINKKLIVLEGANFSGRFIENIASPVENTDAANKQYVDVAINNAISYPMPIAKGLPQVFNKTITSWNPGQGQVFYQHFSNQDAYVLVRMTGYVRTNVDFGVAVYAQYNGDAQYIWASSNTLVSGGAYNPLYFSSGLIFLPANQGLSVGMAVFTGEASAITPTVSLVNFTVNAANVQRQVMSQPLKEDVKIPLLQRVTNFFTGG